MRLKSHRTVEQIARKHRMDVSDIQRQLDMGIPIEHEHSRNKILATDIALQHLDEIPDYYTRLKKMEASAKKEHKKFKDVRIDEEGLGDWFGKSESKDKKPGWVDVVDGDACAREEGETATPKCVSSEKRASMSKEERLAAQAAKRREDPNQPQKSGASKPTMVTTDRKTRKEEMDLQEIKDKPGKGSGKKDACYSKVKSRYDVWPSAYASGALVKCRKVGAANWGNKSEEVEISIVEKILGEEKCGKGMYWCNTNKECKPLPKGFDVPGQKIKPTEVGIGKPVEGSCSKTKKGKDCPVHGKDECPTSVDEGSQISFNVDPQKLKADKTASKIRTLAQQGATEGERKAAQNKTTGPSLAKGSLSTGVINAEYEPSLVEKILGELEEEKKGYPKTLDIDEDLAQARKNVGASKCWPGKVAKGTKMEGGKEVPNCESVTIEDANGKLYAEVIDLIKPEPMVSPKSTFMANNELDEATRLQSETGNIIAVILSWRGKTYSIRMFFPQVSMPSKKDVTTEIQKVYPTAIVLQYNVSTLQPGMPLIQVVNSKSKNYLLNNKTIGEESIEEVAAWQRKEGKSQSGGLNEKGRKSYERENPGSNLQRPQPEGGSRRDSFCARMKGMKRKLTSAKTANDPDSRINKSLRAWNC